MHWPSALIGLVAGFALCLLACLAFVRWVGRVAQALDDGADQLAHGDVAAVPARFRDVTIVDFHRRENMR